MHMVNLYHSFALQHLLHYTVRVYVLRHCIHAHPQTLCQQFPCRYQYHACYHKSDYLSITVHPVCVITIPDTTTPAETNVSASMCKNAPRAFISCCLPCSIHAVNPFTTMATAAVHVTNIPFTSAGW